MRFLVAALLATAATAKNESFWYGQDTWVVVVGASRYYSNYRHAANVLAIRRVARRLGVPRERVLTLLAEDPTLDARNPHRGAVYLHANANHERLANLALDGDEFAGADYAGDEVTPGLVRNLLTGRVRGPRRLDSSAESNVLIYLTGHGGDEFLKFHDSDELSAIEIADAVAEMRAKGRYKRLVLMVDTCQAASLLKYLDAASTPGVLGVASARVGENAYAGTADGLVGVALADRFTEHVSKFFDDRWTPSSTWGDFARAVGRAPTRSTLSIHDGAWASPPWADAPIAAFFAAPPAHHLTPWPP